MIEDVTFSLGTVVQIVSLAIAAAGSFFYLRGQFQQFTLTLNRVTTEIIKLDTKFDNINTSIAEQNTTIIRIEAHGTIMERSIESLDDRVRAMAGPTH
jgi:hypothetical protein